MNTDGEELIADLLDGIVDSLDVPDEMLERTQNLYDDVGEFMRDDLPDDSMWSFRPQGSANLGTIVLPAPGDEFDIDSVATWHVREESITKTDLKSTIGNVLRRYQAAARNPDVPKPTNLDEGRRCWTLEFAEAFHMDVLPSVPDEENPPTGILLTDKTLQIGCSPIQRPTQFGSTRRTKRSSTRVRGCSPSAPRSTSPKCRTGKCGPCSSGSSRS